MRLRFQIAAVIAICALGLPQVASAQIHPPVSVPGHQLERPWGQGGRQAVTTYFDARQPVIRDWSYLCPTVPALPDVPFHRTNVQARQLTIERNVILARGDYAVPLTMRPKYNAQPSPPLLVTIGVFAV